MAPSARTLVPLTAITLILACSSGGSTGGLAGTTSSGGHTGGAGSTSATSSTSTATNAGGSGAGGNINIGCASGIICGNGTCCAAGDECVSDACQPACATQVRCGANNELCCGQDELCLGDMCVAASGACIDYSDCADGQFCEPTLGKCVPEPMGTAICEYKPPTAPLTPTIEWSWTGSTILPTYYQVINMPVVADLDKDGTPDVVIVTSVDYTATHAAYLRALNGKGGAEKWTDPALDVYKAANAVNPRGTPAAADLDGDGFVEIVAPKQSGGLIAFNHDGSLRWVSRKADNTTPYTTAMNSPAVAIADLDADGHPEIVVGAAVFDDTGKLLVDNGVFAGSHDTSYGAVSIIADVNGDGQQEIITGHSAYDQKGSHLLYDNGQPDGYPAIADLDGDGHPEVVVVSNGKVRVQDAATGAVLGTATFPSGVGGAGGPPTIADFDGDGKPDFSTAGGNGYMVFKYNPAAFPTVSLLWSSATQDLSSNRTGSSVFDFQGDGSAEVVYGDECFFRIYSGKDGTILFQTASSSATIHEYPVVVDVDADNQTEVLVVSNDDTVASCPAYGPNDKPRHGLFVYGDAGNDWVRTRRIWNQHAYHITNVGADASIPHPESPSWINPPGLNNYRQSSQGAGVFNAPDLQASLSAELGGCPTKVHLDALVQNHGSLGVAAGVPVTFYAGMSPSGTLISSTATTKALLPGQYEVVSADYMVASPTPATSFYVVVDSDAMGMGTVNECLEDNNEASVDTVTCPDVH